MTAPLYLDHAATTPLHPDVLAEMLPLLRGSCGNPSSVHQLGRAARSAVDRARDRVAATLGVAHREIVFTASGTEADNLALRGILQRHGDSLGRHLVVSAVEHEAVLETAHQLQEAGATEVTVVPCDGAGRVSPNAVAAAVRPETALVSVMLVNNETGVVTDVGAIARAVHERNPRTLVHTDAVQAAARLRVRPADLGCDLVSFSGHKLGGPAGVGALWVRSGVVLAAQLSGGGQERGRRSGTENVAGIVGFATALARTAQRVDAESRRQAALQRRLEESLLAGLQGVQVAGAGAPRAAGITLLVIDRVRSDVLLAVLDSLGVCASGGSACASGAPTPSHVLLAMGLTPEQAAGALRCSLGETTSAADIEAAVDAIVAAVAQVRRHSDGAAQAEGLPLATTGGVVGAGRPMSARTV